MSVVSPCRSLLVIGIENFTSSLGLGLQWRQGEYPGVFIDFVREDGATVVLACVEYDPDKDLLQTVVYGDCASDEPTAIVEHYNTDFEE